jgi:hypothetical protein
MLETSWRAFDHAAKMAEGKELRKGPRGGGRDVDGIIRHVVGGDQAYLRRVAWKPAKRDFENLVEDLRNTRDEVLGALDVAVQEGLPERGPRGGVIWPVRFFVRRVIWHVLDHAWEIEDRILDG